LPQCLHFLEMNSIVETLRVFSATQDLVLAKRLYLKHLIDQAKETLRVYIYIVASSSA